MNLTQKTVSAAKWSAAFSISQQVFGFTVSIILARILLPKDFGLMAIVIAVIGIVRMFQDLGLGTALVQKKDLSEQDKNTVFWSMVFLGIVLFLFFTGTAPLIAHFYKNPLLAKLIIVVALSFILGPLFSAHLRLLERGMDFKRIAIISISAQPATAVIAIYLAITGWGVWSLVMHTLLFYIFMAIFTWIFVKWRPKLQFCWKNCKAMLNFGLNLSGTKVLGYFRLNLVYLLLGRTFNPHALGIFRIGSRVVSKPLDGIFTLFKRPLLPSYSKVQDDNIRLSRGYLMALKYLSLVVLPLTFGIIVTAPEVVKVILGPKWIESIPIIRFLCIAGIAYVFTNTATIVCYAKGRPNITLCWNLLSLIVFAIAILISAPFGILAVAGAIAIVSLILTLILQFYTNKLIELSWKKLIKILWWPFLASILMASLVFSAHSWLMQRDLRLFLVLIIEIIFGVLIYILLNLLFNRATLTQGWQLLKNKHE